MFGTGDILGRGAGADWAGTRRAGVGVTGLGEVDALGDGRRIDSEGSISVNGGPSARL